MPQFILLPLEIVLFIALAAAAYVYWQARNLSVDARQTDRSTSLDREQAAVVEMAREVTDLVAELQAAANTVRNDLRRQTAAVQEMLDRAEATRAELQQWVERAPEAPPPETPATVVEASVSADASQTVEEAPLTLAKTLPEFRKHLHAAGRSQSTVTRMITHVREFVTWLGGQRYDEVRLRQIRPTEIEAYRAFLEGQNYKPVTVKRKLAALQVFGDWVGAMMATAETPQSRLPDEMGLPAGDQADEQPEAAPPAMTFPAADGGPSIHPPASANRAAAAGRYQAVYALANRGLDRAAIASQTGLEREVVRMLLKSISPPQ